MKIYCIPGFGVDEKIFGRLNIPDAELECINWLTPLPKETITAYAHRMASSITCEEPVIIGISFGGMMAIEIAKQRIIRQIILISSVKTRKELPLQLKTIGLLKLDKIFPVKKIQQSEKAYELANKRLGAITEEEKSFANVYRRTADINYINWSFDKILNWRNEFVPQNIIHIHGDKDQIFPINNIKPTHLIENGTHMMAWNKAEEISEIINKSLTEIKKRNFYF